MLSKVLFWLVVVSGIGLRVAYYNHTPPGCRAHDQQGHLEYVQYVMQHWTIPSLKDGYEFYQPPLYYFVLAACCKVAALTDQRAEWQMSVMTLSSLIFSISTFLVSIFIAKTLWNSHADWLYRRLFVGIVAVLPGLIFLGGQNFNNDVLYCLFCFMFFHQVMKYWCTGKKTHECLSQFLVALSILTKGNGLVLFFISLLAIVYKPGIKLVHKVSLLCLATIFQICTCGWYALWRVNIDRQSHLIGNAYTGATGPTVVGNGPLNMLYFNPFDLVTKPYNDLWVDSQNRQYFWEFLYRSAFIGEWSFSTNLKTITAFAELLGLVLILFGICKMFQESVQTKSISPAIFTFVVPVFSLWCYRLILPLSSLQDFRYVPIIVLSLAYYGIQSVKKTNGLRHPVGVCVVLCFIFACAAINLGIIAS